MLIIDKLTLELIIVHYRTMNQCHKNNYDGYMYQMKTKQKLKNMFKLNNCYKVATLSK